MKRAKNSQDSGFFITRIRQPPSVAGYAGSLEIGGRYPRLGFAIAWGWYQLRRLFEWFLPTDHWFAETPSVKRGKLAFLILETFQVVI